MAPGSSSKADRAPRIALVDAARGTALAAMTFYHLTWDLGFFDLIPQEWPFDGRFLMFGDAIAASFLALVGVSLALSARAGLNMRAYLKRLALVAGAAGLVTLVTWWVFPDSFIFFGVLHCIAAASVLALAFLRTPWAVAALAGAAILLAPYVVGGAAFDPVQWWSGLGVVEPRSNDWRPLFPWAGFTLLGLAGAQALLGRGVPARLVDWRPHGTLGRGFVFAGRHSLLFYLVHQPVLFALVFLVSQAVGPTPRTGPPPDAEERFMSGCVSQCLKVGALAATCERACACVVRDSKAANLWTSVAREKLTTDERASYDALTRQCLRVEPLR